MGKNKNSGWNLQNKEYVECNANYFHYQSLTVQMLRHYRQIQHICDVLCNMCAKMYKILLSRSNLPYVQGKASHEIETVNSIHEFQITHSTLDTTLVSDQK